MTMQAVALATILVVIGGCAAIRVHDDLALQAEHASTAKEHHAVAVAYRERAARLRAEAAEHARLADWWSNLAVRAWASPTARYEDADHCRRLSIDLSDAAAQAEALAEAHERIARQLAGSTQ